jgi:hypothetical protein
MTQKISVTSATLFRVCRALAFTPVSPGTVLQTCGG